ncbi:hypothetical protein GCM10010174_17930 [Kutzneria viridogrisea]|uniref:Secreted protein n=2 Tax=Kutzneria TaxID=43356 RepID=W5WFP6_9PSEU|nr:hypothetical protein [Kutzneria albida]AHH99632.1 hypothetical protein KALB_6272 [Kutzneria albida DSM 43870]MBA8922812.1 hypothetical protein [Kutzneria viridogrisea]
MRSRIARRALAAAGVAGLGLVVGAAPAFAEETGKAYAKAEVIRGSVLGTAISPVQVEYPPGGKITQPTVDLGIARLDLVGLGAAASGDTAKGYSKADVNYADAKLTVGIPGGPRVEITEASLDVGCTADGGDLKGTFNLASVHVRVALLPGAPLVDVPVEVRPGKQTGVQLPGGLGEVLINKQTEKEGVITVTALSVNVLGEKGVSLEFAKTTCGPNVPKPPVPLGDGVAMSAGGAALAGLVGFGLYRRFRKDPITAE